LLGHASSLLAAALQVVGLVLANRSAIFLHFALQNADPDQPVMIYCTGGIRCDVYGTYLRQKG